MLECINICLDQLKDDYTPDTICQVLELLCSNTNTNNNNNINNESSNVDMDVVDEVSTAAVLAPIPTIIMRTSILASSKYDECKKFVFQNVIPMLIKRTVWITAPQVWDGVALFIKKFTAASTQKDIEITLRAILGIPTERLRLLIESCTVTSTTVEKKTKSKSSSSGGTNELKKALKKLLNSLSIQEKNEVLSGVWAGISSTTSVSTNNNEENNNTGNEENVVVDIAEKLNMVQSLLS